MASLNKVFLMGNLTREPELRYIPNGSAVTSFGLAVNEKYKLDDEWKDKTTFVDITVWGKQAESCAQYLTKGSGALIEGRLNLNAWETEDGQKRSKLDVVATNVQFLPRGESSGERSSNRQGLPSAEKVEPDDDDDLPF